MTALAIQARIRDGLARAGLRVSANSAPLLGNIVRTSWADETVYPPVPGVKTSYSFVGLVFNYTLEDMRGTGITSRDVKVMVSAPVRDVNGNSIVPDNGDELSIAGVTYKVVRVVQTGPAGAPLYWTCQCRSGE